MPFYFRQNQRPSRFDALVVALTSAREQTPSDSPPAHPPLLRTPLQRRYSEDDQADQPGSKGGVEMQSFSPKPRSMMGDATTVTQPTPAEPWTLFGWMRGNDANGYRPVGP